jgi:hypothetical protein
MIIKGLNSLSVFFFLCICGISACKENKGTSNSADISKVNPFDTSHFETQALTAEDRQKLANASGKTVKPIGVDALADKINTSSGKLYIYCFWNLGNDNSLTTMKALNTLTGKYDSTQLKVVFVNMPGRQNIDDVNLFVREHQLTEETWVLEKADVSFFQRKIRKDFVGVTALPVLVMVNKAEETLLFYNKPMDDKELAAVVEPLVF